MYIWPVDREVDSLPVANATTHKATRKLARFDRPGNRLPQLVSTTFAINDAKKSNVSLTFFTPRLYTFLGYHGIILDI